MDTVERISAWIEEQRAEGRRDDDMDGTVFVLANDKVARISESEEGTFEVEILLTPYTVDFTNK